MTEDELVDEASMESFPASDPPAYWGRTTSSDTHVGNKANAPATPPDGDDHPTGRARRDGRFRPSLKPDN